MKLKKMENIKKKQPLEGETNSNDGLVETVLN